MNFDLSATQLEIRNTVRDFAKAEIAPRAAHYDETCEFPYDVVAGMGKLGLFALPISESVGGAGGDFLSYCLALEEVARADAGCAITLEAAVSLGISPIARFGTTEQQEKWLPDLLTGKALWAFGLTEPQAGSDAGATETKAIQRDGQWNVTGRKVFITNSGTDITRGVTVTAVTGQTADGKREISTIAITQDTPGYSRAPSYRKLGWHSSDTHELLFDEASVPEANLVGKRGQGYSQFLEILEAGRVAIAALSLGLAQACLDASLQYSVERKQFGQSLSTFQATQFKLADMATQIELARLATYKAASAIDATGSAGVFASMAKLAASETATWCANVAVQIHGGYGFMEESPVARYYRDCKVNEIGEGTSEVQRILIARHLLSQVSKQ